jgi:hypothetical protein
MWVIWGSASGVKDIGIVAERCAYCGRLSPCRVMGHSQGMHLYFIPLRWTDERLRRGLFAR